jgi:nitrile hydratase
MSAEHGHEHGHHHASPDPRLETPQAPEQTQRLAERVHKLEALLVAKGLVVPETLEALASMYENDIGPMNGARVVARAWTDPAYKHRLLTNATAAMGELGIGGLQGEHMVVVENTPAVHNVVVCTLCSCYPWPVLGLPPTWYKMAPYRSRMVIDPRGVLQEFGLDLPHAVEVRVWDSSAEIRYMVLPERPQGTAHMNEQELAQLVTRDAMIGVARVEVRS